MVTMVLALVLLNLVALLCQALATTWRPAWAGLSLVFYLGVVDRSWLGVALAFGTWRDGAASLLIAGMPARIPALDPETRLPYRQSCMASGRDAWVQNTTLQLLHRYVGPARGTWQGPIPPRAEARAWLERGQDVALRIVVREFSPWYTFFEAQGEVDGVLTTLVDPPMEGCRPDPEGPARLRVARIDASGLLIGCGERASVWVVFAPDVYSRYLSVGEG